MDSRVQKKIWDEKQVQRLERGDTTNKRRLDVVFREIVRKAARGRTGKRVLNVGIGNGYLEARLLTCGFDAFSLDPSENAVHMLAERLGLPPERLQVGSAANMPFESNFFDFVVMSEVIEHLDDETLSATLLELRRVLKSGGYFVGTCPDNEDLEAHSFTCPYCGERSHRVGHVRSFTTKSLRTLLARHLEVEKCVSFWGAHLNWKGLVYHHYIDLPFKVIRLFRRRINPPHQTGLRILFVARKDKVKSDR